MLAWCTIMFVLGVLAFLDSFFGEGEVFRRANSFLLLLVSLGLLIRVLRKRRAGRIERMEKLLSTAGIEVPPKK